jgi:oligoribonuclease (3'-5' exoribonuclease)
MPNNQTSQTLVSVESLINSYNARLDTLQTEQKQLKEMLNAVLDNDVDYQVTAKEALKQTKLKTLAKQKVLKLPQAAQTVDKLRESQMQIREIKTALSDYLSQYVTLSGTNQIEGIDGVLRQIVYTAKLVKLSGKK